MSDWVRFSLSFKVNKSRKDAPRKTYTRRIKAKFRKFPEDDVLFNNSNYGCLFSQDNLQASWHVDYVGLWTPAAELLVSARTLGWFIQNVPFASWLFFVGITTFFSRCYCSAVYGYNTREHNRHLDMATMESSTNKKQQRNAYQASMATLESVMSKVLAPKRLKTTALLSWF